MQNFFELFNLPMQFDLDIVALEAAYRNVQRLVHPDRFVTASDAEKRAAVQYASLANDAYQTLRNPLKRAMHLCTLNGIAAGTEAHIQMDPAFLMEQMDWREKLEAAQDTGDSAGLLALAEEQASLRETLLKAVKADLDAHRFNEAVVGINKLMFLERFDKELHRALDGLEARH